MAAAAVVRGRPNEEAGPPASPTEETRYVVTVSSRVFRTLRPRYPPLVFIGREGGKR